MTSYLVIKWLHIVCSVVLVGTGFGSAFYWFFAHRSNNLAALAVVTRLVVRADWWFTTPAVIVQPLTGFALIWIGGWPSHAPWLLAAIGCYLLTGVCWLPVVAIQIRMARQVQAAVNSPAAQVLAAAKPARDVLPARYWRDQTLWTLLGIPAFVAMLLTYWLMVAKPSF